MDVIVARESSKLSINAHILAGWPLILIVFGGAVGIIFAVIAYLVNLKVYASLLSPINKVLANLLSGMTAISAWWFCAQWIQASF